MTIDVLHEALNRAKVERSERIAALKRLTAFAGRRRSAPDRTAPELAAARQRASDDWALTRAYARMLHSRVTARRRAHDHAALHAPVLARARHRARPSGVDRAHARDHDRAGAGGAQGRLVGVERREPPAGDARTAGAGAHRPLRRRRAERRAGVGTRAPRSRHRDVAGLRRGRAARRGRAGRRGRCADRRRGRQCVLRAAPARPSRRGRARHGLLPVQQRRGRRPPGARGARLRERVDLRFRRASRQRHPARLRARAARPVPLDPPVAALPRHRGARRRPASATSSTGRCRRARAPGNGAAWSRPTSCRRSTRSRPR